MLQRSLGQVVLHTRFLIARDLLSASMMRLGSGFSPDSVIRDAKENVLQIQKLIDEMERIRHYPKHQMIKINQIGQ